MPTIFITDLDGDEKAINADIGQSLMEVLTAEGYPEIEAICGGCCACATCHVHLDEEWFERVGERGTDEDDLVSGLDAFKPHSRLSCQIEVTNVLDGLKVTIAEPE